MSAATEQRPASTTENAMATLKEEGRGLSTVLMSPDFTERLRAMLPSDVPVDKFRAVVLRAAHENPDLLKRTTDKQSLLTACQRAAQDGLIPDGREGALVMYGNKVQWQPMIGGIRKRLAEHGFDIRAEVVFANDTFDYDMGDDPRITHKAPPLGQKRGEPIGAYAIARHVDGRVFREVMSKEDIEYVRVNSKSGPTWNKWWTEMAKKTVARRLQKQLPVAKPDDRLRSVLESDDLATGIADARNAPPAPSDTAQRLQAAARAAGKPADSGDPEAVGAGNIDGDTRPQADQRDEEIAGEFREVKEGEGEQQRDAEF